MDDARHRELGQRGGAVTGVPDEIVGLSRGEPAEQLLPPGVVRVRAPQIQQLQIAGLAEQGGSAAVSSGTEISNAARRASGAAQLPF